MPYERRPLALGQPLALQKSIQRVKYVFSPFFCPFSFWLSRFRIHSLTQFFEDPEPDPKHLKRATVSVSTVWYALYTRRIFNVVGYKYMYFRMSGIIGG
jgi:hypothetical protein